MQSGAAIDLKFGLPEKKVDHPATLSISDTACGAVSYWLAGITIVSGLAALAFLVLAVIGTVHNYSPVPYWDMWDDYIGFYLKFHAGDWGALWAQHGEHRIILARLVFWIDIAWFRGNGIFSLTVIYLLVLAVGVIFVRIWQEQCQQRDLYILLFAEAWIFSWIQQENLTWAFQSQFILAQLLPLASLYLLHRSTSQPARSGLNFVLAILCGVLSVGSMANGVLALPAMTFYGAIVRFRPRRLSILAVLSLGEILLYFNHYTGSHFPGAAPTLTGEISTHFGDFIAFLLVYLGSPAIDLLNPAGSVPQVILLGKLLAAALVLMSIWKFYRVLKQTDRPTLPIALLVFIFYIVATAAVTAAGRLPLGINEALSSRYATPTIYGWAAALLLFWPAIAKSAELQNVCRVSLALLLCFFMFPQQLQALGNPRNIIFQRELAALALELQINDADQISKIYPRPAVALAIASQARDNHLSIFGFPPIENAHLLLGTRFTGRPSVQCRGVVDATTMIAQAPQAVRVRGWVFNSAPIDAPGLVILVNQAGEILGLGFVGDARADARLIAGRKAKYAGFDSYLSSQANGQRISIVSPSQGCELPSSLIKF